MVYRDPEHAYAQIVKVKHYMDPKTGEIKNGVFHPEIKRNVTIRPNYINHLSIRIIGQVHDFFTKKFKPKLSNINWSVA